MSMKEFLEKNTYSNGMNYVYTKDLFDFLWERGGKGFVKNYYCFAIYLKAKELSVYEYADVVIKEKTALGKTILYAQDFLDCVAIDEERVKSEILKLKVGNSKEVENVDSIRKDLKELEKQK